MSRIKFAINRKGKPERGRIGLDHMSEEMPFVITHTWQMHLLKNQAELYTPTFESLLIFEAEYNRLDQFCRGVPSHRRLDLLLLQVEVVAVEGSLAPGPHRHELIKFGLE